MADWTDEERQAFNEAREKSKADLADERARIKVGDYVDTPGGPGWVVSLEFGGCKVNLEADLPTPRPGLIINKLSGQNALFVPSNLMRKIEGK